MLGPYSWAPPYYWFNDNTDVDPDATSYTLCWEQGSNEIVPPFETLVKYMPSDHLWPVDTWWAFHASTWGGGVDLSNARNAIDARFGIPAGAEEFCKKAQVLNYESNRAQMESIASRGWAKRKGSVYWQLNSHYPGTFAHLVDYYYKQGGAYYGAKKGLRQLNVTYDYNAKGDRSMARIYAVNQTMAPLNNLEVQVKIYDLDINEMYSNTVTGIHLGALSEEEVMQIPRVPGLTTTFFVRCWLRDTSGNILAENFYWDSTQPDKIKAYYEVDTEFEQFADLTGLNRLASVDLDVTSTLSVSNEAHTHAIQITNNSDALAFFVRAEITRGADGEEVLPVFYSDNYISIFPKETHTIYAEYKSSDLDGNTPFIRIEGYNVNKLISHSGE
jgi:exo-1,4-beta-D-glucosaminidase